MWVVMFKDGDAMNCEAMVIGPYATHDEAYDALCELPSPRSCMDQGGYKYIQELERSCDVARVIVLARRAQRDLEQG